MHKVQDIEAAAARVAMRPDLEKVIATFRNWLYLPDAGALVVALGVIGWIIKRVIERLDLGEKRMTKIEVELAAQRERDRAVEARIAKVEEALKEVHNKLDRMMEVLVQR